MEDIVKIAAIGLVGVLSASLVKNYKKEFSTYIVIATIIVIFMMILEKLTLLFDFLGSIYNEITYGKTFFPIILKVLAVAYLADFTAQLCRDSGEGAIANKVELAGKVIIFYLAIPILIAILELINSILE